MTHWIQQSDKIQSGWVSTGQNISHRLHLWSHQWQDKEWQRHDLRPPLAQGNLCKDVNNKILVIVIADWTSICSIEIFFWQFRVQYSGNCHERDRGIPHRTHTRALFLVACVTFHSCALRMAEGMMSLCESSQKSFLHRSCRRWVFLRLHSLLCFLHLPPHRQHQRPLQRYQLESDWISVPLRSGMDSLADWLVRSQTHCEHVNHQRFSRPAGVWWFSRNILMLLQTCEVLQFLCVADSWFGPTGRSPIPPRRIDHDKMCGQDERESRVVVCERQKTSWTDVHDTVRVSNYSDCSGFNCFFWRFMGSSQFFTETRIRIIMYGETCVNLHRERKFLERLNI